MSFDEILAKVDEFGVPLVELTGGEPLAQADTPALAKVLLARGYKVLIETSGAERIDVLPRDVHVIMDLKCPDSKMSDRNLWDNIPKLKVSDEIKFVVASRSDFDWAIAKIAEYKLAQRCQLLMSPAFGLVQPKDLVDWMLESKAPARLNLQQHKYIWSPRQRGV
jgi:7-carboxy-7-deazaguanine synthase